MGLRSSYCAQDFASLQELLDLAADARVGVRQACTLAHNGVTAFSQPLDALLAQNCMAFRSRDHVLPAMPLRVE